MSSQPSATRESLPLYERQHRWGIDAAAFRDLVARHEHFLLRIGDRFNELQAFWGDSLPRLVQDAGVSYDTVRRHALLAQQIPPESPVRRLKLPYSILRLIAPLAEQQRWADEAAALQQRGKLRVRAFAAMLEAAGARQPRVPRVLRCARCGTEQGEATPGVRLQPGRKGVWLCSWECVAAYADAQGSVRAGAAAPAPPSTQHLAPNTQHLTPTSPPAIETHAPAALCPPLPPPAGASSPDTPSRSLATVGSESALASTTALTAVRDSESQPTVRSVLSTGTRHGGAHSNEEQALRQEKQPSGKPPPGSHPQPLHGARSTRRRPARPRRAPRRGAPSRPGSTGTRAPPAYRR